DELLVPRSCVRLSNCPLAQPRLRTLPMLQGAGASNARLPSDSDDALLCRPRRAPITDKKLQVNGKGAMSAPFLALEPGGRWGQTENAIDRAADTWDVSCALP